MAYVKLGNHDLVAYISVEKHTYISKYFIQFDIKSDFERVTNISCRGNRNGFCDDLCRFFRQREAKSARTHKM